MPTKEVQIQRMIIVGKVLECQSLKRQIHNSIVELVGIPQALDCGGALSAMQRPKNLMTRLKLESKPKEAEKVKISSLFEAKAKPQGKCKQQGTIAPTRTPRTPFQGLKPH